MKHQKEWHTCDRCSVEIEYNYSAVANIEVEKQSYSLGICGVIYKRKTQRESNSFDLCPKCRKDFERFMRNENINTRNSTKKAVDEALDNATINNVPFREWIDNVNNAYANKKCNLTSCQYNADGKCTNEEKREECVGVSRKVLCINEENKK